MLRRIAFVRAAQRVGLSLDDIKQALSTLPDGMTPTAADWKRLSLLWRPLIDRHIAELQRVRARLDTCIGCGCLSLRACTLLNPHDVAQPTGQAPGGCSTKSRSPSSRDDASPAT